jgi:hypothetical protein
MEMVDGLAAVGAGIDHDAVAVSEAFVAGDLRGREQQMSEEFTMVLSGGGGGLDVLAGDDEEVYGRLGIDIGEGVAAVVLVDGRGGDGALDDLAEQAAHRDQCTGGAAEADPVQLGSLCPASYGSKRNPRLHWRN